MMQMEEKKLIPSLKDYVFPTEEIKKCVEDLMFYHQLNNQTSVALYSKWKGKKYFKGSLGEMMKLSEIRDLLDVSTGKAWDYLTCTLYLLENYSTEVEMDGFYKLPEEYQQQVIEIIQNGQKAKDKLREWIKPIDVGDSLEAIHDAIRVTFGEDEYSMFQILKFADVKTQESVDGITIHENLLEIDNPSVLIDYFKRNNDQIKESLVLAFMRHSKRDWKPSIYLIFFYNNQMYVIEFSDRRLNQDNTAGDRTGGRRFYEAMEKIHLPMNLILTKRNKTNSTEISVRDQKVFIRANMFELFLKHPEIKAWMDLFIYRIIDYIKNPKKPIELGITTLQVMKALEDKSKIKIELRMDDVFESRNDASSYMLKKYSTQMTSIVPALDKFPMILGTKSHVEGVVKYKQREILAKELERLMYNDWKKNHKRVYEWLRKLALKQDINELIKRALENNEYPIMIYPSFSDMFNGKEVKTKIPKIFHFSILKIHHRNNMDYVDDDDPREMDLIKKVKPYWRKDSNNCNNCNKFKWKVQIVLEFNDYRQIYEFFKINKEDLPTEYIDHLHNQNEVDIGNPILDDTDPVDEIKDFWFRQPYKKEVEGFENTGNMYVSGKPSIKLFIHLCNTCMKSFGGTIPEEIIREWRCPYCNRGINQYNRSWHIMNHEEKGDKIKFENGKRIQNESN